MWYVACEKSYMLSGKVMAIRLIVAQIKRISLYKMSCYPEPGIHSRNKIEVELDLSNYATKSDLKDATSIDASEFVKLVDLASLKSKKDKF